MPTWDPEQYLRFEGYRSRPCREMVGGLSVGEAARVIDLGCGPGNSTEILAGRYPGAEVVAMDSSAAMLEKARGLYGGRGWRFELGRVEDWVPQAEWVGTVDVILSNAVLQWVKGHGELLPRLMRWLRVGGQLAVQMPRSYDLPVLAEIERVGREGPWREKFAAFEVPYTNEETRKYYDWLAPVSRSVELWEVMYFHRMASADEIVEWSQGTGLRPWLEHAGADAEAFLEEYRRRMHAAYPRQADGSVLMGFRRLFILATR